MPELPVPRSGARGAARRGMKPETGRRNRFQFPVSVSGFGFRFPVSAFKGQRPGQVPRAFSFRFRFRVSAFGQAVMTEAAQP